jgi:hypothetical protein
MEAFDGFGTYALIKVWGMHSYKFARRSRWNFAHMCRSESATPLISFTVMSLVDVQQNMRRNVMAKQVLRRSRVIVVLMYVWHHILRTAAK